MCSNDVNGRKQAPTRGSRDGNTRARRAAAHPNVHLTPRTAGQLPTWGQVLVHAPVRAQFGLVDTYAFNLRIASEVRRRLLSEGYTKSFLINEAGTDVSLDDRGQAARDGGASLFLSLHHDSVQPSYLSQWTVEGQHHAYSDRFHGYSIFTSRSSPNWAESMEVAKRLGQELRARNHTPTLHHAERISGERRPLLDANLGVYAYDGLAVLKRSAIPAVLLECGVLVNRDEEIQLDSPMFRAEIVDAIAATVKDACERRDAVTVSTRPAASTAQ